MKVLSAFIAIFLTSFQLVFASTIKWDVASLDVHQNWADLDLNGVPGRPNFDFDFQILGDVLTMSVDHRYWTLAHAMNFVEMHVGDTVDETTVRGSDIVYFHGQWLEEPGTYVYRNLQIQEGETAYLGFAVDEDMEGVPLQYGWLSIIFDGSGPVLGQSAVELSGAPIVILPRQIPEPGTFSLVLVGIVVLSMRGRM
jgi:hypothetical protein